MIQIFDILKDEYWKKRVIDSIPSIINSGHHNSKNYQDLESRLYSYDCFNLVVDVDQDELLAISGLYNGGIYPKNIARILDRTYYYNWRNGLQSPYNDTFRYNTYFVIPYQIEIAKQNNYDLVFISVQNIKKRKPLVRLVERQPAYKFHMLENLYNTCRLINNAVINCDFTCWQNVAVHYLKETQIDLNLPNISFQEYYERYGTIEGIR